MINERWSGPENPYYYDNDSYTIDLFGGIAKDGDGDGVIQRIFNALQQEKIIAVKVEILALDSTSCKVHPDAHGALKKEENNPSENQKAAGIPAGTGADVLSAAGL